MNVKLIQIKVVFTIINIGTFNSEEEHDFNRFKLWRLGLSNSTEHINEIVS